MIEQMIADLLKLPKECEWVEYKLNYHSDEEIGKNISALSNGACLQHVPFGFLLFGIDDDTIEVKGTSFRPKMHKVGNEEPVDHAVDRREDHHHDGGKRETEQSTVGEMIGKTDLHKDLGNSRFGSFRLTWC